jgi:hypothetical protein
MYLLQDESMLTCFPLSCSEAQIRSTADSTEIKAREAADDAEIKAREAGDAATLVSAKNYTDGSVGR